MSVYIKGMEMPTNCHDCEIGGAKQLDKAGNCPFYRLDGREQEKYSDRRVDGCPLVPVPPHGRLIDADALSDMLEKYKTEYALKAKEDITHLHKAWGLYEAELMSESLPTIIEEER